MLLHTTLPFFNYFVINFIQIFDFFFSIGCPSNAFCDYGICRCKAGYDARFGSCWNNIESFNQNQAGWNRRQEKGYNPHVSCETHNNCGQIDMNMICFDKNSTCQCRETMAWNDEALECQIYIVSFIYKYTQTSI